MADDNLEVRFGANTTGLEAGAQRSSQSVRGFSSTMERATQTAAALRAAMRTAFGTNPGSALQAGADRAAGSADRLRNSATQASAALRTLEAAGRGAGAGGSSAAAGLDRAAASSQRLQGAANGARGAVALLVTTLGVLGIRQLTTDMTDAAFAGFGFNTALTAVGGGALGAGTNIAYVEQQAARLGLVVREAIPGLIGLSGATNGTVLAGEQTREIWLSLVEAGTALNRSNEQLRRGQEAVTQIASKGVVSMEEIRQQLSEAIPGAVQIGARAMGMTSQAFNELVASGELLATEFLPRFAAQLRREFGPSLEAAMNSPLGRARREIAAFQNQLFQVQQVGGQAFLVGMTEGLRALNNELERDGGEMARDLGRSLGESFATGARAVVFLAQNIDSVVTAVQLLTALTLSRWMITVAAEARVAAAMMAAKGVAARAASMSVSAAAAQEVGANMGIRASIMAAAQAEVQKAQATLLEAQATAQATRVAYARAAADAAAAGSSRVRALRAAEATAAMGAMRIADDAAAAAAVRLTAANNAAAASTTLLGQASAAARGLMGGLLAMVGGPWGAAFLAAGAATYLMWREQQQAAERAAELTRRAEDQRSRLTQLDATMRQLAARTAEQTGETVNLRDIAGEAAYRAAELTDEVDLLAEAHWRAAAAAKAHAIETARALLLESVDTLNERRTDFDRERSGQRGQAYGALAGGGRGASPQQVQEAYATADAAAVQSDAYERLTEQTRTVTDATRQLRQIMESPLGLFQDDPVDASTAAGGGSGGSGPSRVSTWQNELEQMLMAENNFFADSRQTELNFWQSKRDMTAAGSQDRLDVDRRIYQLQRSMAEDAMRATLEAYDTEIRAAEGNQQEQARLMAERVELVRTTYGEGSREYQRALQEQLRMAQQHAQQTLELERRRIAAAASIREEELSAMEEIGQEALESRLDDIELLREMGIISAQERTQLVADVTAAELQLEAAAAEEIYRVHMQALRDELELQNLRPQQRQEILDEIERVEAEHNARMAAMAARHARATADQSREAMRESFGRWQGIFSPVGDAVGGAVEAAVAETQTLGEVWNNMGRQMLASITRWLSQIVTNWIASQMAKSAATAAGVTMRTGLEAGGAAAEAGITAIKTGAHIGGEGVKTAATLTGVAVRTGAEAAGGATSIAISASTALADVANSAVRAAAGAYAAVAGIPVVGPVLAPVMAATALAAVLALGKTIFSAERGVGSVANDGDMYQLHKEEMVLPADIARPLRRQLSGGPVGSAGALAIAGGGSARASDDAARTSLIERVQQMAEAGRGRSYGDVHIHATDARSVRRLFEDNGDAMQRGLERQLRNLRVKD